VIEVASGDAIHILVATFGGAVIGLERQWSGHATGPNARFAGVAHVYAHRRAFRHRGLAVRLGADAGPG
jgi:hypothetical protein